jgi:hypothetical protein
MVFLHLLVLQIASGNTSAFLVIACNTIAGDWERLLSTNATVMLLTGLCGMKEIVMVDPARIRATTWL